MRRIRRYAELVALDPWDYGGPEHVHRAPSVAIVDPDGVLLEVEDELADRFSCGDVFSADGAGSLPSVATLPVATDSPLRALLVYPQPQPAHCHVRATTLGVTHLDADETCGRWLGQRPGALFKYLLCRRYSVVHTQEIAQALWGYTGFVSSGTVRQCVHELRQKLEASRPEACPELVVTRQGGYALNGSVVVDADDFAVHVRRGVVALGRGQQGIATVHLRQAVAMYRGDFLSDEAEAEWAQPERERLREHMEDALEALVEVYTAAGDATAATSCLRRLAQMRPYDIDVQRCLVAVLLAQNRYSHAQRTYQALCSRLWRELSIAPGFTLRDLACDGPHAALESALPAAVSPAATRASR